MSENKLLMLEETPSMVAAQLFEMMMVPVLEQMEEQHPGCMVHAYAGIVSAATGLMTAHVGHEIAHEVLDTVYAGCQLAIKMHAAQQNSDQQMKY